MEPRDLKAVFSEALDREPGSLRSAYLDEACQGDAALRAQVEDLLRDHDRAGRFLESATDPVDVEATRRPTREGIGDAAPETEAATGTVTRRASAPEPTAPCADASEQTIAPTIDQPAHLAERAGDRIGPFKLLQEIGEGGMGTVFMAEQTAPIRRTVALKLVKPGLDSRQVLARFEAERQALALMDHPNIAKVLDAGTTETGRPYFVMELVKGIPITQFCDECRLTLQQRLELFIPVCQAVQHAHQKGVIHRDLKPSNVLVALYDGRPVPKVIDFGVAKATGPRLTERTLFTEFGAIVGTPEYMSPEQAAVNQLDVDTRSDIYGLGVLLYELLTGTTPLERRRLRKAALLEVLRIIREEEPQKPSTRLATTEELPSIAANRNVEPLKLKGLMRGELDWIVMKCLEKDRDRRYDTAAGLARDLERYLHDEPVAAGPPSSGYRLRKFAQRNRKLLATAAVVAAALVIGTSASTWQAVRATRAEGLAQTSLDAERAARGETDRLLGEVKLQRNRADVARQEADRRATEATEVVDFLINDLIGAAAPSRTQGKMPTVDQVLARSDESIAKRFADRPLIEASIRLALARAYEELSHFKKEEQHAARAVELRLAQLGPEHAETIGAQNAQGWALYRQRRFVEARALLAPVLETARRVLGPEHPQTLHVMYSLASALGEEFPAAARTLWEELLAIEKRVNGPEHPTTLSTMHNLALILSEVDPERGAKLCEQALAIVLRARPYHPNTLIAMNNLANLYHHLRQVDLALDLKLRSLDSSMRVLGVAHLFTRSTIKEYYSWIQNLQSSKHPERARTVLQEGLQRVRRELGPKSRAALAWTDLIATVLALLGRADEAIALIDGLPADQERPGAPELHLRTYLALLLREHGRRAEAHRLLEGVLAEALRLRDNARAPDQLIEEVRGFTQVLLARWPGLAPGIRPEERPPAPFTIEAPFRTTGPVADGRIALGEYSTTLEATFDDDANPGRLYAWGNSRHKAPDDLTVRISAAHTDRSLFLAFQVRDQVVQASNAKGTNPVQNDSVEVFINGDQVANDLTFVSNLSPRRNHEGFQLAADALGHQYATPESITNAEWTVSTSRTPDGYIVEFEIPLALIDTRDGPESVPAASGSELRVNFGFNDIDGPQSGEPAYAIFWAEDPALSPFHGGEDFWTVKLRLVPQPTSGSPPADARR